MAVSESHPYAETYDTDGSKKMDYPKVNWAKPEEREEPEDFEVRLCVGCHHYEQVGAYSQCKMIIRRDYVMGNHDNTDCFDNRKEDGPCGPEGNLWEAKP